MTRIASLIKSCELQDKKFQRQKLAARSPASYMKNYVLNHLSPSPDLKTNTKVNIIDFTSWPSSNIIF